MQDRIAAGFGADSQHGLGDPVQCLIPCCRAKLSILTDQGSCESVRVVLAFQESTGSMAKKPLRDRMLGIAL
jgi:hypothetical protein